MNHNAYKITDIVNEAKNVKTFFLDKKIKARPGQFVMAWLPGINEKPFSLSYENAITVKNLGPFTSRLFELGIGEKLWLRGPYGTSFNDFVKESEKYIIAGGTGAAPLAFFVDSLNKNNNITVLMGARSMDDLVFENRFRQSAEVMIATMDGSEGIKGFATDLITETNNIKAGSQFFVCGPEKMAISAVEKASKFTQEENIILSLERYMKCGCGICGNCEMGGLRVCIDGPVFAYSSIKDNEHFGKFKRDKSGKKVEL
jgi:dihydroorotate dehydrogenase electron transfer subunit